MPARRKSLRVSATCSLVPPVPHWCMLLRALSCLTADLVDLTADLVHASTCPLVPHGGCLLLGVGPALPAGPCPAPCLRAGAFDVGDGDNMLEATACDSGSRSHGGCMNRARRCSYLSQPLALN